MKTRLLLLGLATLCCLTTARAELTNGPTLRLDYVLNPTDFGIDPQEFGDVLCADGNRVALHQTLGQGLVHVFAGTPEVGYTKLRTFTPPDTTFDKVSFGASLGFRGNVLYVGNPATWRSAPHDGTAYLFNLTNGSLIERWTESPHAAGYFGQDGGIADDLLYVEQGRNGSWGTVSGVYLYRVGDDGVRTPVWSFIQTRPDVGPEKFPVIATRDNVFVRWSQNNPTNSTIAVFDVLRNASQDFVGIATNAFILDTNFFNGDYALAAQGNLLATANPYFVSGTNVCGAVLLYKKTNSSAYVQTATLLPPDLENNALFGFDLKFVSGKLVVGSPGYKSGGTDRGCVYSYSVDADGNASLVERYQPALRPFGSEELFGSVIATAGGRVVVGSSGSRNLSGKGALYLLSFTNPPPAITNRPAFIFWTDVDEAVGSPNHSIKRANTDGSGISNVVTGLSHPRGMAVDSQGEKIYWTETGLRAIRRANFDGSGIEAVISATEGVSSGIALDVVGGKIYWTDVDGAGVGGVNSKLHRANLDGSSPEDLVTAGLMHPVGIALDVLHGKMYWTDLLGNHDGAGRIQRANLDGSNVETLLTGIDEAAGLALDPVCGKLYWPELSSGKIERANLDGSGLEDLVTGLGSPTTIGLDLLGGKMYWTDSGPPNSFNRIQKANLDGSGVEVIVSGVGFPWGIAFASQLPPATNSYTFTTLAGQAGSEGSAEGTGSVARFSYPFGVALDVAGNAYVSDTHNHTIRKVTPGGAVSTLAGLTGNPGSADGSGNGARFFYPVGVAVDSAGNVYVADHLNNTIRQVTPSGVVSTLAGQAGSSGSTDGTAGTARFYHPHGVAVDSAGNIYVADTLNHTIRQITPAGVVSTLAGLAGNSGSTDGTGSNARFNGPTSLVVDGAGNVYVTDSSNHTVRKITPAGVVSTVAGEAGSSGSTDGIGNNARLNYPAGLALDSAGNLFLTDYVNETIRKITPAGVVSTLGGLAGVSGSADGTGSDARFFQPRSVAVDCAGNLYVADEGNFTIRKGVPSGGGIVAPSIITQPADQTVQVVSNATFNVTARGSAPLLYQWRKDGLNLPGVTNATLTFTNVQPVNIGDYSVVVRNAGGSVTSSNASLNISGVPSGIWQGLLAYYDLNGTFDDLSGHRRDLTPSGSVSFTTDRFGTPNTAGRFDRTGVLKGADEGLPLGNSPRTVTLWFNPNSISPGADVMFHWGGYPTASAFYGWVGYGDAITFGKAGGGDTPLWRGIRTGTWYAAAFVYGSDGQAKIYLNGTLVASAARSFDTVLDAEALTVGGYNGGVSYYGSVDDLRIYNKALSDAEVAALYASEAPPPPNITVQPTNVTADSGGSATFTVTATGTGPLAYQWRKDGLNLPGATNATLTFTNVQPVNIGDYSVVVRNAGGSVTSSNASLTIPGVPSSIWQGMVAYYPLDGNANDEGAIGLHCESANVQPAINRFGSPGGALQLDGVSSVIIQPTPAFNIGQSGYTVSLWMASDDVSKTYQGLFNTIPHNGMAFVLNHPPAISEVASIIGTGVGGWITGHNPGSKNDYVARSWYQVVFVKDGTRYSGYVNAQLDHTFTLPAAATFDQPSGWHIGGVGNTFATSGQSFQGRLDDVRIYNHALTPSEVAQMYTTEADPPVITQQPQGQTIAPGGSATFTVEASANHPLTYQWRKDGLSIPGATNASHTIHNAQPQHIGLYSVVVGNGAASVTSSDGALNLTGINFSEWAGLVAYYPFNGNADDAVGTNNGTLVGATPTADRFGHSNHAYSFDGTTYIQCPDTGLPSGNSPRTVTLWMNVAPLPFMGDPVTYLFGYGGYTIGSSFYSVLDNVNPGGPYITVGQVGGGDTPRWHGPTTNVWYHIAITYSNSTATLYVNGFNVAQAPRTYATTLTGNFFIGTLSTLSPVVTFYGALDEVRVYNRALSDTDVRQLYVSGSPDSDGDGLSDAYEKGFGRFVLVPAPGLTWEQARVAAEARGGHLATITTPAEWDVVLSLVSSSDIAWIGGKEFAGEGSWGWITGEPWGFVAWQPGQPSGGALENHLWIENRLFHDVSELNLRATHYLLEYGYYTDPNNPDTDSDGFTDGDELVAGSSPVDPSQTPPNRFNNFTLLATTPGGGLVIPDPLFAGYPSNRLVRLAATAAAGWTFLGWQGDVAGNNPVHTLTMSRPHCVQGIFGTPITRSVAGDGSVRVLPEMAAYPYGATVDLVAEPQPGYYLSRWSNSVVGAQSPRTHTMNSANPLVTALFAPLDAGQFALTLIPDGPGRVTATPQTNRYPAGTQVTLRAFPDAGQTFTGWSGDASGTENPLSITMDQSKVVTASFTRQARMDVVRCLGQVRPGAFILSIAGKLGERYELQCSPDLEEWLPVTTLTNSLGTAQWSDPAAAGGRHRFYRAVLAP